MMDRDGVLSRDRPDYIKNEDELEVFPFARAGLETFKEAGWLVYVVSNQSVVGRGLASLDDVEATTAKLVRLVGSFDGIFYCYHKPEDKCTCRKPEPGLLLQGLAAAAAAGPLEECWMVGDSARDVEATTAKLVRLVGSFDGIFYCYHRPEDKCTCRKPEPGLLLQGLAAPANAGPLEECWMVGDSARDVEAGRRAGCRTAVVLTGRLTAEEARRLEPPPDVVADNILEAAKLITASLDAPH